MISNLEKLKKLSFSDGIKIVSFDIFDTLLIRKIDPPNEVKRIVSINTARSKLLPISPNELLELRNSVESKLREESKNNSYDPECSIGEIIERLVKHLGEKASIKEKLIDLELEIEKSLIAPMLGIKSLLRNLSNKYQLIAISDTYLPLWMLKELLNSVELGDFFEKIYSSCEYKLNKGSGRLFKKILELEQIDKSQILHIGDNFLSDYFVPRTIGISSILLYEEQSLKRRRLLRSLNEKEKKSNFWKGYSFMYRLSSAEEKGEIEDWGIYSWGRNIIGPLITVFIHILVYEVQRENFQRLYFIAREGFLLKKLFNLFSESLYGKNCPKSVYLCISRYTSFLASIRFLSDRELKYATWGSNLKIKDVLNRLGIQEIEVIKNLLMKHNLDPCEPFDGGKTEKSFYNLYTDPEFAKIIIRNSQVIRELTEQYLRQLNFFSNGSRIALIDVGWTGTIQDCIEEVFSEIPDFPTISGYYLALNSPIIDELQRNKKGLIYDYREPHPEEMFITLFREALEFSCRAYHSSTMGYKKLDNGRVIPLFKNNSNNRVEEKQINKYISIIQKGIMDFAKEYLKLVKILDINPIELQPFIVKLYDLYTSFPSKEQINALERIANSDDFGSDKLRTIVKNLSFKEMVFKPNEFFRTLIETPWREASLSKMGIPFLPTYYYLAKRLVCWSRIKKNISNG